MSGRILVHIGLPKTATTTLQREIFPKLSCGEIRYLGVVQPRKDHVQSELFTRFSQAVCTGLGCEELVQHLSEILESNTSLVISEEMFTVSSENVSWKAKLTNLSKLLRGLDYSIVVTVREPAAAMFSYYTELHQQFSRSGSGFLDLARNDERMQIFHYKKLTTLLFAVFDPDRIFVETFENIVAGRNEELCRFMSSGSLGWSGVKPKKHNEKRRTGGIVYTSKKVTLADCPRRLAVLLGVHEARFVALIRPFVRPAFQLLDRINLFERKLVVPSDAEMEQLRFDLRKQTYALEEHFGIKY